jgi:hypothetical protein
MPVLVQKRQQFDLELTATERTEIADCRAALKQLQSQHHDWKKQGENEATQDNHYYGQKHESNPEFEQHKAIMKRLEAIAEKHSNSLQQIKTQLEPAHIQWMNDIHKLQSTTTVSDEKSERGDSKSWHGEHGPIPFPGAHHMAAHFLLLPATAPSQTEGPLKEDFISSSSPNNATVTKLTSFQLMPNPASNDVQLGNDILPPTNLLKVIDLQGKEVLSLENVQAAQHIDVSQLAGGTYLVQIKSGDQTVSKKIVINK